MKTVIYGRSEQIRRFAAIMGVPDPVDAVRQRAGELVHGLAGPPYDLDCEAVRTAAGIKHVRYKRGLQIDGRILWQDDGYLIEINSARSRARQRFTLAHELGHTFFIPFETKERSARVDQTTGQFARDNEEEYLCDVAASEMLMPTSTFFGRVFSYGPSVKSILTLARDFGTSLRATARRFAEIGAWKCHIGFWQTPGHGAPQLEVGFGSGSLQIAIPKGFKVSPDSVVAQATSTSSAVWGRSNVGFQSRYGEPLDEVFVQALYLPGPRLVISVAVLEVHPEHLCSLIETRLSVSSEPVTAQGVLPFAFDE